MSVSDSAISTGCVAITVKGKPAEVPALCIDDRVVIVTGKWLTVAMIMDEELVEGDLIADPALFLSKLKSTPTAPDIFTFAQKLPDTTPRYSYYHEWDNLAVIPITTFDDWWAGLSDPVQRAVKKAKRSGVVLKEVEFDDAFIRGIQGIYDETPVRQGKLFWHYRKDFDAVKAENSTYADRNIFIGAYFEEELIGFIRLTSIDKTATVIQILSQMKHQSKRPTNALIAKAVEVCEQRGVSHLVYCNYVYTDPNSSLTEFKRRNRFEPVLLPRYYCPLTLKGELALKLKLHHGFKGLVPQTIHSRLVTVRSWLAGRIVNRIRAQQ